MTIRNRLRTGSAMVVLLALAVGASNLAVMHVAREGAERTGAAAEIVKAIAELSIITDEYLLHGEQRARIQWQMRYASLAELLTPEGSASREGTVLLERLGDEYQCAGDSFLRLTARDGTHGQSVSGSQVVSSEFRERTEGRLLTTSHIMISDASRLHELVQAEALTAQRTVMGVFIAAFGVLTIIFAGMPLALDYSIRGPLAQLQEAAKLIGSGDLDHKIDVSTKDELGELSRTLDHMREQLRTTTTSMHEFEREIAERKGAETALRESEERFSVFMEHLPAMAYIKDETLRHVYGNPAAIAAYGKPLAEYIGTSSRDTISPELSDDIESLDRQVIANGAVLQREFARIDAAGATQWIRDIKFPVYFPDGSAGVGGIAFDITERKVAEEEQETLQAQLGQAQKMESVGRLAGGVAHDFNNMLGVILGHAELAMEQMDPGERPHMHLEEIHKAAERSAAVTRQLLGFARKQTAVRRVLDLNGTVEGMLSMLRRLIGEDVQLAWMPGAKLSQVLMDPGQIDQILVNLCINARDAIGGAGKIIIETSRVTLDEAYCAEHLESVPGEYALLAVSDDGCGMETEVLEKVFEPFFTTKGVGEGTGLGLSTLYGIVRQNEGHVDICSEPGVGTTFRIYLPRHTAELEEAEAVERGEIPQGRGETVLLAEDEEGLLKTACGMLRRLGYRVLSAGGAAEAIRFAETHAGEIDLLITDVVMPRMNGRELAGRISELMPSLKCLYMSGYTADVIARRGILDDDVLLMNKPFDLRNLSMKVREALEQG